MGCGSSTSAIRPVDTVPRQEIVVEENARLQDPEPVTGKRKSSKKCSGCGGVIEGDTFCNSCKNRLNKVYHSAEEDFMHSNQANNTSHLQVSGTNNETGSPMRTSKDDAAIVIQAAYRGYITRKETRQIKWVSEMVQDLMEEALNKYYEERTQKTTEIKWVSEMVQDITQGALKKYVEEETKENGDENTDKDDQSKIKDNIQLENKDL